jgi:tetratricopeptide (TPR) repeat protein
MTKQPKPLTVFGKDLDNLLEQAGKLSIREYADQAGVDYQYISQLRHMPDRHPGKLYVNLLKPFATLKILGVAEAHQLSVRHRKKPLSLAECKDIFPELTEQELANSIKQVLKSREDKTAVLPAAALSPFYQRVFVGRETEMNQLQSAFNNAVSNQGSLVMVVGEPGIGKTALTEQLATYVTSKGGKTLTGHCYSERSLSLPYLAFVEALGSYARSRDVMELKKEVGTGAADIARIIPEIRERLKVEPRPKGDPDEERYRLMQSVVGFLSNIASTQPILFILEDLHNADKGTLEMLTHVCRNMAVTRLLLVSTYRDVEVDRTHPLSSTLAELRRLPMFKRVLLRGLNADEVSRMLSNITGQEMPLSLAEAIHRQTEGNPLFVQEVVRYLVEEGVISPQGEVRQKPKDIPVEMKIPDGLRDVIGKRLSSLSVSCNRMLAVAAVIGRDFRLEVLQKVAGMTDEEIFKTLDEAKKAAVIEERTGVGAAVNYRFAHAFFQQTLYEEIIAPRRIRLHQQVARTLEKVYKTRLEEHAAELAEHFSHSSTNNDLKKAVSYGEMAAKRAIDVYAYGEAVRLLDQAIKVQEVLDPEDKVKLCDLLIATGEARLDAGDFKHIMDDEAPQALALAEALGDGQRMFRISWLAYQSIGNYGGLYTVSSPEGMNWINLLDKYALPNTEERVVADMALGGAKAGLGEWAEARRLLHQGISLARELKNADTFALNAAMFLFLCLSLPEQVELWKLAEEIEAGWQKTSLRIRLRSMPYTASFFLAMGESARAADLMREFAGWIKQQPNFLAMKLMADACFQLMNGELEEATKTVREIGLLREESGQPDIIISEFPGLRLAGYLGRAASALREEERKLRLTGIRINPWSRAYYLAHAGEERKVTPILDGLVGWYAPPAEPLKSHIIEDMLLLETAVVACHKRAAEMLFTHIRNTPFKTTGFWYPTCVARHLGGAAALLERYDEARKYYDEAIKVCTEMKFRPELALTRLQFAELLLEHYPNEKKETVEHLDFAIKEFQEMKMQTYLERALRHKEILKA